MTTPDPTLGAFSVEWEKYQRLLVDAVGPLDAEQLALRIVPSLRSMGEIATHIIGGRARWVRFVLKEGDDALGDYATWDREGAAPRTGAELARGLEATWGALHTPMTRWTTDELAEEMRGTWGDEPYALSRRWVVWHLIEHDIHHGGELSFSLGIHDLPAIDI
jgi:uncharacterized damage-inducible protein DinB